MTNRSGFTPSAVALACLLGATAAHGQIVQAPPRPVQQAAAPATRPSQSLTATASMLAGVDDNIGTLSSGGPLSPAAPAPKHAAYTGIGNGGISYSRGTASRAISVSSHGYFAAYQHLGSSSVYGGDVSADARTSLGRRMTVSAAHSTRNEPLAGLSGLSANSIGTSQSGTLSSALFNPATGVAAARSWAYDSSAQLRREWTRRMSTTVRYAFSEQKFKDRLRFDTSAHVAGLGFDRSFGRRFGAGTNYTFNDQLNTLPDGTRLSKVHHSLNGSFRAELARGRDRVTAFSFGGGVIYSDGVDPMTKQHYESWNPSGHASLNVGIGRTWSLSAGYQHLIASHPGVQPVSYITHAAHVSGGGSLTRKLQSVFTASHSRGRSDPVPQGALNGVAISYTGTAQLSYAITPQLSAVLVYNHFQYWLDATASLTSGIYDEMHRNSIRIGLSWSAPIGGGRPRGGV